MFFNAIRQILRSLGTEYGQFVPEFSVFELESYFPQSRKGMIKLHEGQNWSDWIMRSKKKIQWIKHLNPYVSILAAFHQKLFLYGVKYMWG